MVRLIRSLFLLTSRSAEMDHSVVIFEHVHFFNVIKWLDTYPEQLQSDDELKLTELLDRSLHFLVFSDGSFGAGGRFTLNSPLST